MWSFQFTEYEGFIYECLGLQKNSTLFPTGKSFEVADSFINEASLKYETFVRKTILYNVFSD